MNIDDRHAVQAIFDWFQGTGDDGFVDARRKAADLYRSVVAPLLADRDADVQRLVGELADTRGRLGEAQGNHWATRERIRRAGQSAERDCLTCKRISERQSQEESIMTAVDSDHTVLIQSLLFAVPLWILELQECTPGQLIARAKRCAQVVAEQGDALQFKGKSASTRRSTTVAFNGLAEGLACAAYQPGGVVFAGRHWCVGSRHSGVAQEMPGPCDAEVERERAEGPAATRPASRRRPIVDVQLPDGQAS